MIYSLWFEPWIILWCGSIDEHFSDMFLYSVIPEYIVGETTTTKLGAVLPLYDSAFMLSYASHLLASGFY